MSLEMVVLLLILATITAAAAAWRATVWYLGRNKGYEMEVLLSAQELLEQEQQEADILNDLLKAQNALKNAIVKIKNSKRIAGTAPIKDGVLSAERELTSLKKALEDKLLKSGGVYVWNAPTSENSSNANGGGNNAAKKIQEAMTTASAYLGRKVGFKEILDLVGKKDSSIKKVEDFQKLSNDRQDQLIKAVLADLGRDSVTTDVWTGGDNGTTVIVTPHAK